MIRPALAEGKTVVSDRYLLANVVYQGHAGGLDVESIWEVGRVATGGLMPELTIVLDMPAEAAAKRLGSTLDRMERQGEAFHARVRAGLPGRGRPTARADRGRRRRPADRRGAGRHPRAPPKSERLSRKLEPRRKCWRRP